MANRLSLRKLFIATVATLTGLALTGGSDSQIGAAGWPPPDRPAPMVAVIEAALNTPIIGPHARHY